jgi:heterodisulfide reductase subunit B
MEKVNGRVGLPLGRPPGKVGLFPGCSLEGSSNAFQSSLESVFRALNVPCDVIRDWNCCGASSAHSIDHRLYLALNLRNLAQAQRQGYEEILAPCAACYHRLACAQLELSGNPKTLNDLNAETGLDYGGRIVVRNVLDYLANGIGVAAIAARVKRPLSGLRVACYYGCLNTRVPHGDVNDSREYPMAMDNIARVLGARPLDWSYKTECCGASLFVTQESISARLVARILENACAVGADCIAVACPMCQNNLDTKQEEIRAAFDIPRALPVVFITQLMGLAFGAPESELKLQQSFVPFRWSEPSAPKSKEKVNA